MSLSGPGDSTSRSRSLISVPPAPAGLGGSVQLRAIRSCPAATALVVPPTMTVLALATVKVFSVQPAPAEQLTWQTPPAGQFAFEVQVVPLELLHVSAGIALVIGGSLVPIVS